MNRASTGPAAPVPLCRPRAITRASSKGRISSGIGREILDVREDRSEHILNDRLAAPIHGAVWHSFGLVPLDVGLQRRENCVDVSAPERVIDGAPQSDVCLTHSFLQSPRGREASSSARRIP
jgi:hypothetical protein